MRSRPRSQSGPNGPREGGNLELVRLRRAQRDAGASGRELRERSRRRGGRGRSRPRRPLPPPERRGGALDWLKRLFGLGGAPRPVTTRTEQEERTLLEFQQHFQLSFGDPELLRLALTHRSYLSVTGQGPRDSNERLEFLGDSVLGLVTSEFLYRRHPDEHEGELTKNKSLLVSKAILSRRALAMGLGRFVLMSHSEVESGGRQRLSILADAFEAVIGAIYLDQGFEAARGFIHRWLLREAGEIVADKRHTNYKSHLQEYVQSSWRTHPVYRIRSEMGPDHSKHFLVEVMVGKRTLGEGRGHNKKEAEQAAARDALEKVGAARAAMRERQEARERRQARSGGDAAAHGEPGDRGRVRDEEAVSDRLETRSEMAGDRHEGTGTASEDEEPDERRRRRGRRGGRGRRAREGEAATGSGAPAAESGPSRLAAPNHRLPRLAEGPSAEPELVSELEPLPPASEEDESEEVGRPEGPHEELHVDPYAIDEERGAPVAPQRSWDWEPEPSPSREPAEPVEATDEGREYEEPSLADLESGEATEEDLETSAEEEGTAAPPPDAPSPPSRGAPAPPAFGRRRSRR
jgi:ribonuclease-3